MKRSSIILLVLIAVAIGVIVSLVGDFSTYETFASAARHPDKEYRVIGVLDKSLPQVYDPQKDPNYFSFYVKDKAGNIRKVVYTGSRPTDFERSEQIVLTGHMQDSVFACSQILMKCPSKYKNDQVAIGRMPQTSSSQSQ
ncbi:MAG: cytochrome c maturation protein CcmE [Thermoflavifilum sp.]|jgi:cytochrome c-type biogenesis protein CcmE|uniref:cytochrome c maturation protein CcmE domain-containing protein n=1 Tax=Thermoflavifilum sp. TaxID=1968839 RepID=UPI0018A48D3A|nr:cytochrome c maturation protein CcmE [Thermoflavifilum sp.]QOR75894.1 MAG: cytochrome c maturation protein CcmE [Thermoflavifilum sp.]